jgi:hypothetical protein
MLTIEVLAGVITIRDSRIVHVVGASVKAWFLFRIGDARHSVRAGRTGPRSQTPLILCPDVFHCLTDGLTSLSFQPVVMASWH